jgi:topoisomerase-4 subunit B
MNPIQLRETTIAKDTRCLIQLTLDENDFLNVDQEGTAFAMLDMLLAKKLASDRKAWLEEKGDMAGNLFITDDQQI